MKEIRDVVYAWEQANKMGMQTALATLVNLQGSSYRRPGARLLVSADGMMTGGISGGCLEGDALKKAVYCLSTQKPRLVVYDTRDEEDAALGVQLGCAGIVQVLFEPVQSNVPDHAIALLSRAASRRQCAVLTTCYSPSNHPAVKQGTCLLLDEAGTFTHETFEAAKLSMLHDDMREALTLRQSITRIYGTGEEAMYAHHHCLLPPLRLVIAGAGNDAIPLQAIAGILGWEVHVVDGRYTEAKAARFPGACQVWVSKPDRVLENFDTDEKTVFVLMTHNYPYDLALLSELFSKGLPYLGILGPKKRLNRMMADLAAQGVHPNPSDLEKIYGPAGLELGAETPQEIALSIAAEILAVVNGRRGGFLRNLSNSIHDATRE